MGAMAGADRTTSRIKSRRIEGAIMVVMAFIFIAVLLAGVPVFIALAGASFIYTHFIAGLPDFVILHRMAGGIDSFPLLAVPFFILAGNLMNSAGITNRIYDFAVALAGWTRGGLAHVNIIGSVIFAGMSGTAIADAAGLGTIEIKAMKDHGYDTEFSVGVTAASSTLGPIIPPSLPFVIYGMMGNVSIGALFLGGVIPGAVMTIFMMAYVYYCARRYNMGRDQAFRWKTLGLTFVAALPALLTPAIIIGGMTFGWFTPTEAAIAACAWAMILGIFLYRTLSPKQFYKVTMDTIETTAGVLLIVAAASLFGWVLTTTRVTEYATDALLSVTDNRYVILLLANIVLLVVGCFLEPVASISILVPVLMPVILKVGIDPVHFGVVMTLNLMIGLLHPPLGMVLFVLSRIAKLSLERTTMAILPWLIPLLMSLIAITLIPDLTLWLPRLAGLVK
jgi:tripartite ATP-independent transporter DctM subunit